MTSNIRSTPVPGRRDEDIPSFGRRRGRKLSQHQAGLLARLEARPDIDLTRAPPGAMQELFRQPVDEVWLEIGFGGGEHMIGQALAHRRIGIIGAEPFVDGVVKALSAVEAQHLTNVLIYPNDVRPLLRWLPAQSIARVFILFPDPWPKKKHAKRRLVSPAMLDLLAGVMRKGAELRIATDIGPYARTVLLAVRQNGAFHWTATGASDWRQPPDNWIATRYEQKARKAARPTYYFTFLRE